MVETTKHMKGLLFNVVIISERTLSSCILVLHLASIMDVFRWDENESVGGFGVLLCLGCLCMVVKMGRLLYDVFRDHIIIYLYLYIFIYIKSLYIYKIKVG